MWNNTIVRNRRPVAFSQDTRRIQQLRVSGHDPRRPLPDLTMPWVIGQSSVGNNVLTAGRGATAMLAVESYEHAFDAGSLAITANGNVYAQAALGDPQAVVLWARKDAAAYDFVLLDSFRARSGQEQTGVHALFATPVDGGFRLKSPISDKAATVAQALPADVAAKVGRTAGVKHLGTWDRPVG